MSPAAVAARRSSSRSRLSSGVVAPDESGVDLRGSVARDQSPARDRQPHGRSVLVHTELVGNLALTLVGEVARELLAHVRQ